MRKKYFFIPVVLISLLFFTGYAWTVDNNFRLPEYEKFVMKNGLTVYLMEQHEVPLIYVSVVIPAGAVKDGKMYGLASLTADALLFGTKSYTKNQIEEKLDFVGANCDTNAVSDVVKISASFAKKDMDTIMPIIKEIIVDPVFNEKELDKRKRRLLLQLERAKERPREVIGSYFNKFLFGQHGYGNPVNGIRTSISKITIENIKDFYMANYQPGESAIAFAGDFEKNKMRETVKGWFKGWEAQGTSKKMKEKQLSSFKKNRVLLVNKEDATETRFFIGGLGIKRSNPDYVTIQVVNTILGGRFTSWLNDELRINAGLTYRAHSFFSSYKTSGTFIMCSFTRTSKTIEALDLVLEVLGRLHKKGINKKTLESAKNYIKGQYPPRYETSGALANLLTNMFIYDFNESFINDFNKNVDQITVRKAKEIIKKYFSRDNLQFVLIGKASEIRDKVKKYGEMKEKEVKAVGF